MPSIGSSKNAQHAVYRRLLSHGFSNQALQAQEPLVTKHIDLLMTRLRDTSFSSEQDSVDPPDLLTWFMWATFDIMGDLAFGETFGCLHHCKWHPWTETTMAGFEAGMLISAIRRYVPLSIALHLAPRKMIKQRTAHYEFAKDTVARRMARGSGLRPDFISYIMQHNDDGDDVRGLAVTPEQVQPNAAAMVLAGGHTTSTVLSGAVYYLLKNPETYRQVVNEVRSAFKDGIEMTYSTVSVRLPYMLAVLEETLRIYPPVPLGLPKMTPPQEGIFIDGRYVPENIRVSVLHIAASRSPRNFCEPDSFRPERWLESDEDNDFNRDNQAASQPFGYGPRSCLGRHLAYMEMRLILAKLLWNFDLRLDSRCQEWSEKKIFLTYETKPLWVHLTVADHSHN